MLKREWEGRYVRLLRDIKNVAGGVFEKGAIALVNRNYGGLHLERLEKCHQCNCRGWARLRGVSESSVELLPKDFKP